VAGANNCISSGNNKAGGQECPRSGGQYLYFILSGYLSTKTFLEFINSAFQKKKKPPLRTASSFF
jgi:hypothetical protein